MLIRYGTLSEGLSSRRLILNAIIDSIEDGTNADVVISREVSLEDVKTWIDVGLVYENWVMRDRIDGFTFNLRDDEDSGYDEDYSDLGSPYHM